MPDLTYRQQKIQDKRKQTPFRDFVMEICSWFTLNIYKVDGMLSRYPDTVRKGVLVKDQYASMNNEQISEYTGDFFVDFVRLYTNSPKSNLIFFGENENATYTDGSFGTKNAYLSFDVGGGAENVLYSACVNYNCANVINSSNITTNSENVCWSKLVRKSFNIFYSTNIDNSSDIWFCSNCIGCHNCIDCDNLTNASYIINNIQLSKKEFLQKKEEILEQKADFNTKKLTTFARMGNINAINSTGKGLMNADNMQNGYMVIDVKDCRNLIAMSGGENRSRYIYDSLDIGINSLHNYAVTQWGRSEHIYCSFFGGDTCSNCYYCTNVQTCSFCLGCIGLKNKQFCIFNKQYTKEERHEKIDEIFTQMDKDGTLGQFFPATMNPFYFNDTAAYLIDPTFTKEEVEKAGYLRRDEPIKVDIPAGLEQVNVSDLDQYEGFNSEGKRTIDETILKKVIIDDEGNCRRIVKMEYDFLVKYGLPLPRKHRLERMKENFRIG